MSDEKNVKVRVHLPNPDEIVTISEGFDTIITGINQITENFPHLLTVAEKKKISGAVDRINVVKNGFDARANKTVSRAANAEVVSLVKDLTPEEVKELLALKAERENAGKA